MQLDVAETAAAVAAAELEALLVLVLVLLLHATSVTVTAAIPVVAARERRCQRRERPCSGPVMGRFLSERPRVAMPMDARSRHMMRINMTQPSSFGERVTAE
jgi:hypothetical protein